MFETVVFLRKKFAAHEPLFYSHLHSTSRFSWQAISVSLSVVYDLPKTASKPQKRLALRLL
jgi:hypothetical protein